MARTFFISSAFLQNSVNFPNHKGQCYARRLFSALLVTAQLVMTLVLIYNTRILIPN
jgi:hypothetical protein